MLQKLRGKGDTMKEWPDERGAGNGKETEYRQQPNIHKEEDDIG